MSVVLARGQACPPTDVGSRRKSAGLPHLRAASVLEAGLAKPGGLASAGTGTRPIWGMTVAQELTTPLPTFLHLSYVSKKLLEMTGPVSGRLCKTP